MRRTYLVVTGLIGSLLVTPVFAVAVPASPWIISRGIAAPADNVMNPDRIALGRNLFFDPRLSAKGTLSCAGCHNPALGWADGLPRAIGHDMKQLGRASPTIINAAYNTLQMWDGRRPTLESQAIDPFLSPDEQNLSVAKLTAILNGIPGYASLFARAYPGEEIGAATVGKAIASFERTLISADSPFDRWQQGDAGAVDTPIKRGFVVFTDKGHCSHCHQPPNFNDDGFHNIGLKSNGEPEDLGRFAHRKVAVLKGAFKTPTLRDIAITGPYMHNGLYQTLEAVVEHYDRGGDIKENLSQDIYPLKLTTEEKSDLVAFMRSLTGAEASVTVPRLPQ